MSYLNCNIYADYLMCTPPKVKEIYLKGCKKVHQINSEQNKLNDITREKTLSAISHVANGKTHEERMKIV